MPWLHKKACSFLEFSYIIWKIVMNLGIRGGPLVENQEAVHIFTKYMYDIALTVVKKLVGSPSIWKTMSKQAYVVE